MHRTEAEILGELGPFPDFGQVNGVCFDGRRIWVASGDRLNAIDPDGGAVLRSLETPAHAGTTFDGQHLYQIFDSRIHKIDPETGEVLASIPTPDDAGGAGLAWAEGSLWLGQYQAHKIHQLDPETGRVLRTLSSDRFVTGVTWMDGQLWHGAREGDDCELRQLEPETGEVLHQIPLPPGEIVSGLGNDGARFFCGDPKRRSLRVVKRP